MQASPFTGFKASRSDETIQINEIRLLVTLLFARKSSASNNLELRERVLVSFIDQLFGDRADQLSTIGEDNPSLEPLVEELLSVHLATLLAAPFGSQASSSLIKEVMRSFLRRIEVASVAAGKKAAYAVEDNLRWFDQEPLQRLPEHSFAKDTRMRLIGCYHKCELFIESAVDLSLGLLRYHTELAWKLAPGQRVDNCLHFVDQLPIRDAVYQTLRSRLPESGLNPLALVCHFPRLGRLLPDQIHWHISARHLVPRFFTMREEAVYLETIVPRIKDPAALVDQLLDQFTVRCRPIGKNMFDCLSGGSGGLEKCTAIAKHYFTLINPLLDSVYTYQRKLPLCAGTALLSQLYDARRNSVFRPFWLEWLRVTATQLKTTATPLTEGQISHNTCEHLARVVRTLWECARHFDINDVTATINDVIVSLKIDERRQLREACRKHFNEMMRQYYLT